MTFEEILDQAVAMLQRRGRVTYRALKAQFQLDDEMLEALKEELLYSQPQVVDDEGKGLIWTGETAGTPVSASPPAQTTQPPDERLAAESRSPEAERRQLTVMFCDLVDSTKLSSQLDPEDYREVVRQYQQVCSEVIQRYDGHVAQLLGDGLLVYFGYPQAHEDDAQRAVRSGLGIIEAIETLNSRLEQDKSIRLAVRLGIHTGLVVVGEMGGSGRLEQLALGETPNVAARIQGLAEPDTIIISDATYRLIQGFFDCDSLGEHDLRGVSQPIAVYRVLGDRGIQSRLDIASTRGLTPLVGREREVGLLLDRWEQAKDGQGQVVLLSGEAGIGKSRLVQVLKDCVAEGAHTRLECRSSPYFTNSALYPITDFLQWTLRFQTDDTPEQKLEKLTQNLRQYCLPLEESVPLLASLLALPFPDDRYPPLNLTPQRQRQKMLEAIVAITLELSERQPVLFILEDLHWVDPTTLELLNLLIDQAPTASVYVLLTCRPEFQPPWQHRSYLTEVTVNRLSQSQIKRMAEQVASGKVLPVEVVQQLVDKSDGVPLYVEEMTKSVLESGVLKEVDGRYELTGSFSSLAIPATLQDSLMARLDRLVTAKAVAQYASVIGRQFSYELLQAVSQLDETMLHHELERLVEAELVYQRGVIPLATYIFKHALIQDTAYESLLRSTRQGYHRRISEVLEERFPETAENQPELLAHHYTESGLNEHAVHYWQQAGERAVKRSAYVEARGHLTEGLHLLPTLPETTMRLQHELRLLSTLGPVLLALKGHAAPELEQTYIHARGLCQELGDTPRLFQVSYGLWLLYNVRGEFQQARELGEQLLVLAQHQQDAALLVEAHLARGVTLALLGEMSVALEHLEQGIARYDPQQHHALAFQYGQDPRMICQVFSAFVLWWCGFPEQSLRRAQEALALAQDLSHLFTLASVRSFVARVYQLRRESRGIREQAEAAIALSSEQGFPLWVAFSTSLRGWALMVQGNPEEGVAQIRQGLDAYSATAAAAWRPYFLALLAEASKEAGQVQEGLTVLDEALALVNRTEERNHEAELHRLKGQLLLQQSSSNASEAESCFHQAISIAQHQSAKSWELRAATSLAKLWRSQGKRDEARELLAPVYSWFTEGFDTADLIDAKTLLDELEGAQ
jgi:TOMM system kinase/cyclase fusion protein